jgi:membrane protease YdiL (CAAX protease family)
LAVQPANQPPQIAQQQGAPLDRSPHGGAAESNGPLTEPLPRIAGLLPGIAGDGQQAGRRAVPPWTFVDVFAGLGVVLLASLLISSVLAFTDWDGGPARLLVAALPVWIGLLGTAVWACRRHGTGVVRELGLHFKWVDLFIGLGAGLGLRLVIGIWAVLYNRITGQTPSGNLQPILGNGFGTGVFLVINVLVIAVVGPVIEEIFFRGLGLRSALASLWRRADRKRYADPRRRVWYATGATSALFAVLHMSEVTDLGSAVVLLPGLFVAGWVLARLTIWSGRLGPAIVTHMVFNGVAVLAVLALQ